MPGAVPRAEPSAEQSAMSSAVPSAVPGRGGLNLAKNPGRAQAAEVWPDGWIKPLTL
jgi:hypothetical protein